MKKTLLLLLIFSSLAALSFGQASKRLLSKRSDYYQNGWFKRDSTYYTYTGTRGAIKPQPSLPDLVKAGFFDQSCKLGYVSPDTGALEVYSNTYDAQDRLISRIHRSAGSGVLQNVSRELTTYYTDTLVGSYYVYSWDNANMLWAANYGNAYSYDAQRRVVCTISTSAGLNNEMDSIYHGAGGRIDSTSRYAWSALNSQWLKTYVGVFTYSTQGRRVEGYMLDSAGSRTRNYLDTSTYDIQGRLLTETLLKWQTGTNSWIGHLQNIYQYDANGNQVKTVNLVADTTNGRWSVTEVDSSFYNASDLTTSAFQSLYNADTISTIACSRYYYGPNLYLDSFEYYLYDPGRNSITASEFHRYEHDADGYMTSNIATLGSPAQYYRADHYWYGYLLAGISDIEHYTDVKLYPNPSKGKFSIAFEADRHADVELTLYDIEGRLITKTVTPVDKGMNNIEHDAVSLAPGMYLYELSGAGIKAQGKVAIE